MKYYFALLQVVQVLLNPTGTEGGRRRRDKPENDNPQIIHPYMMEQDALYPEMDISNKKKWREDDAQAGYYIPLGDRNIGIQDNSDKRQEKRYQKLFIDIDEASEGGQKRYPYWRGDDIDGTESLRNKHAIKVTSTRMENIPLRNSEGRDFVYAVDMSPKNLQGLSKEHDAEELELSDHDPIRTSMRVSRVFSNRRRRRKY